MLIIQIGSTLEKKKKNHWIYWLLQVKTSVHEGAFSVTFQKTDVSYLLFILFHL